LKATGDEPEADAVTWYDPSALLGAAVTVAWPLAMTAGVAELAMKAEVPDKNTAVAPLAAGWATKVI